MNKTLERMLFNTLSELIFRDPKLQQREAAQLLGLSHPTLNKYLKNSFGITFKELRSQCIIQKVN